jgi:hypothetical protein
MIDIFSTHSILCTPADVVVKLDCHSHSYYSFILFFTSRQTLHINLCISIERDRLENHLSRSAAIYRFIYIIIAKSDIMVGVSRCLGAYWCTEK